MSFRIIVALAFSLGTMQFAAASGSFALLSARWHALTSKEDNQSMSELAQAAFAADIKRVEDLLAQGADRRDLQTGDLKRQYRTPLMKAFRNGNLAFVQQLCHHLDIADIAVPDELGRSVLIYAAKNVFHGAEIIDVLFKAGAHALPKVHYKAAFQIAALRNNIPVMEKFIQLLGPHCFSPTTVNIPHETPLIIRACYTGNLSMVTFLCNHKEIIDLNAQDQSGDTALLEAAAFLQSNLCFKMVSTLLEAGADATFSKASNHTFLYGKDSALKRALCYHTDPRIAQRLIGYGANTEDLSARLFPDAATPLIHACKKGNRRMAQFLCRYPNDILVNCHDTFGKTALSYAVTDKENGPALVELLYRAGGVDLHQKDWSGKTPLALALCCGNSSVVEKLLALGAEKEELGKPITKCHNTPLIEACMQGNIEMVRLLCSYPDFCNKDAANCRKTTALMWAASHKSQAMVTLLLQGKPLSSLNHTNSDSYSALSYAINHSNKKTTQLLLEAGAHPNQYHPLEKKSLYYTTIKWRNQELTALLEQYKAEPLFRLPATKNHNGAAEQHQKKLRSFNDVNKKICALITAFNNHNNIEFKSVLSTIHDKTILNTPNKSGYTLVMCLASLHEKRIGHYLDLLLKAGIDHTFVHPKTGNSAFAIACMNENYEAVKSFLHHGAENCLAKDTRGKTMLEHVIEHGEIDFALLLLDKESNSQEKERIRAALINDASKSTVLIENSKYEEYMQRMQAPHEVLECIICKTDSDIERVTLHEAQGASPTTKIAHWACKSCSQMLLTEYERLKTYHELNRLESHSFKCPQCKAILSKNEINLLQKKALS